MAAPAAEWYWAGSDSFRRRAIGDAAALAAFFVVVTLVARESGRSLVSTDVGPTVAPFTAAVLAIAGAVLAAVLSVTFSQSRTLWLAGSLGAYGLVVLVTTAAHLGPSPFDEILTAVHVVGVVIGLGGLVAYSATYRRQAVAPLARRRRLVVLAGVVVAAVFVAAVVVRLLDGFGVVSAAVPPTVVAVVGGSVGMVLLVAGHHARSQGQWRVGLGLGGLAVAYLLHRVPPWDGAVGVAGFEIGRVAGLAVVVAGLVGLLQEGHRRRRERERELLAELAWARRSRRAQAERDHELRNSISGLSLLVPLLADTPVVSPHDPSVISNAAASELSRMEELLDRGITPGSAGVVEVAPVVERAVLTQSRQGPITIDVPDDLATRTSESTVALVMTNVLANCARHAAGSAVHISGRRHRDRVVIEVSDVGRVAGSSSPPVPPAHGRGIGLTVCRRLLEAEGARLETAVKEPGHTVILDLPAVT